MKELLKSKLLKGIQAKVALKIYFFYSGFLQSMIYSKTQFLCSNVDTLQALS